VLDRAGLVRRRLSLALLVGTIALAVALTAAAGVIYRPQPLVFAGVVVLATLNRLGLAPLALHSNRHRTGFFELLGRRGYAQQSIGNDNRGSSGFVKTTLTVLATLVAAGLLGGSMMFMRANGPKSVEGTSVRVESVDQGDLIELVQAPGEVQPLTKVSISAKVASRIIEIPHKEGDQIKKGDVLVRLDASDLQASLRSAEARYAAQQAGLQVAGSRVAAQKSQLEGLRATVAEALLDYERQKGLLESHDVSQAVVDAAKRRLDEQKAAFAGAEHTLKAEESNLLVLQHQLEAADAEIARAKEDVSYTIIESPLDGVVTTINAKVGELVVTGTMNNAGTVIMEVADLSQMLVQARVDETDVAAVEVGQPVRVHMQAYPGRTFLGKISSVALARTVERGNTGGFGVQDARVFKVEVLLDTEQQRIFTGLTADVEIETHKHTEVLKVPSQAVLGRSTDDLPQSIRDNNPNVDKTKTVSIVVYRFVDGKAVVTPVTVGPSDLSHTLIRSGVNVGDRIITGPYKVLEGLAHDQKVKEETKATTQPATTQATP
jgi:HlyD family secretion protein